MSIKFLSGRGANATEQAQLLTVPSENSLFVKERAVNGFPGSVFKFGSAGADDTFDIDLNHLVNGGFENWSVDAPPDDWTNISTGIGSITKESSVKIEGSYSCKFGGWGGSGTASIQRDEEVLSGEEMSFVGRLVTDGSSAITVKLFCLETAEYLTSGGVWQSASTNIFSYNNVAWSTFNNVTFTVRPFSITRRHKVTLRIIIENAGGAGGHIAYADDFALWPGANWISVHSHNLGSNITVSIQADNDSDYSSLGLDKEMTIVRPSFYELLASVRNLRFWRFLAEGTNFEPIKYGELVLGQTRSLTPDFQPGSEVNFMMPQVRSVATNMQTQITKLSDDPIREYLLEFLTTTEAEKNSVRDQLLLRSNYGEDPIILIPDDNNDDVIYGRYVENSWSYIRTPFGSEAKGMYSYSIRIVEDPLDLRIA